MGTGASVSRGRRVRLLLSVLLLVPCFEGISLLLGAVAQASTATVTNCLDNGSAGSLRQTLANAGAGATVTFAVQCPSGSPITVATSSGPIVITKDVTISGPGATALVISGANATRLLQVNSGATVTLSGITLEDGSGPDGGSGGIDNEGTLTIEQSTLSDNQTSGAGGAIESSGSLVVTASTFTGNGAADGGGAIFNDDGQLSLSQSLLSENTATSTGGGGGAIFNYEGPATISSSTLSANGAPDFGGGAIWNYDGSLSLTNTTLWDNSSEGGGALWGQYGTSTIDFSTLADNSGPVDGGGAIYNTSSTLNLRADILAGSTGGNCVGAIVDQGGNVADDESCGLGAGSLSDTSPNLDPAGLGNNGGPLSTIALEPGSPAIDEVAEGCPSTDERGAVRSTPCDAGAFDTDGLGQGVSFTSTAPTDAVVGGVGYVPTATATSGLAVSLTVDASASSVCAIADGAVSFTSAGTCLIDANQSGDDDYQAAPQVQQSFSVAPTTQSITFTTTVPANAIVGGPAYQVGATGGASGNPVTFVVDGSASSVCSVSGTSVSFTGVGTCVIDANQTGDNAYQAAPQAQQSFPVGMGFQVVSFTSLAPGGAVVGGSVYRVTTSGGGSGNPVVLAIDPTAATVCAIVGTTVSFIGSGTCVVDANQAGNVNYEPAVQVQQPFAVGPGAQTVSFSSTPPSPAVVGAAAYAVSAVGGPSGEPVVITADPASASVCSVANDQVSFEASGTCTLDANQAASANYEAAPQAQQSFTVDGIPQTITFTTSAPPGAAVGDPSYLVEASGGASGSPVTFAIDPSATSVCSLAGQAVSFVHPGTCTIDANQAGNAQYAAAPQAPQSFVVQPGSQTITFTTKPPTSPAVAGPAYPVAATGGATGNPVVLTVDGSSSSVCTIQSDVVYFVGSGRCVLDANEDGNSDYQAAAQTQQSFDVAGIPQSITFTSAAPSAPVAGGPSYTVAAVGGTSGNPVTFSIDQSASSVCSISGAVVSFIQKGLCVINANEAGNGQYSAASQAQQSFEVAAQPPCGLTATECFTSAASYPVSVGESFLFPVTTSPSAKVTDSGRLPKGVKFHGGRGTAVISGTPVSTKHRSAAGDFTITITAVFGKGKTGQTVTQTFTLEVSPR